MNQLYQQLNQGNDLITRFNQFRQTIHGNPQQMVQQMLQTGRITQAQYNAAVQQAQQLGRMLGMKS